MSQAPFSIRFDHLNEVIFVQYSGVVSMDDLGLMWMQLFEIDEFTTKEYGLLVDFRKVTFNFELEEVDTILPFFHKYQSILKGQKRSRHCRFSL